MVVFEKPVTGMTVAERWWEVGRRCERGELITSAMLDVFGAGWTDNPDCIAVDETLLTIQGDNVWRRNYRAMVAYFLALEAEDAEREKSHPYGIATEGTARLIESLQPPPTADVVAEEEPMQSTTTDLRGLLEAQRQYNERMYAGMQNIATFRQANPSPIERRTPWNTKLADGLRKWAHWLEERF